jgi:hypothetical protein
MLWAIVFPIVVGYSDATLIELGEESAETCGPGKLWGVHESS